MTTKDRGHSQRSKPVELSFGTKWAVFGPVERGAQEPDLTAIAGCPAKLTVGKRKLSPHVVDVSDERLDLRALHGAPQQGRTAYVFIPVKAPKSGEYRIGIGADWWFSAWVDGKAVGDTLAKGNGVEQPRKDDHEFVVRLDAGKHTLAVKLISGSKGAVLCVGTARPLGANQRQTPARIVFIGAGSFGFTRCIVRDLLTYPLLRESTIVLTDIHPGRLEMARRSCQRIVEAGHYPATVVATLDRREALKDADAVLVTILCGSTDVWQHDILIPKKYGVDINVGDTRGPAGIFRALRTIPEMLAICRDMEELCPRAIMLNYTNPMAMLCHAMQRRSTINVTGLCHSVQHTAHMLAEWAGVRAHEVDYVCAGINHLAWYTKFEHQGRDLYPVLKQAVSTRPEIYNQEQVRNEVFLALGSYVTESSGHSSEYNWWFRKRADLMEKYCTNGTNWNPGLHAFILKEYLARNDTWKQQISDWINSPKWQDPEQVKEELKRSPEYASAIINAYIGGEMFRFNGNVPNTNLVTNLPQDCCVEVPVLASKGQLQPIHVGALPLPVVPLTSLSANIEMMAVEASLTGDPTLVYRAICNDPLSAAVLSLAEIKKMTQDMFRQNRRYLPQFKSVELTCGVG
jgi:alpha-galactosidase